MTDAQGLLVAATDKTSDYLQADEDWWQEAFHAEDDGGYYGPIEFDRSAHAECISL